MTEPRLTAAQYDTLARAAGKPICRAGRSWYVVGSHQRIVPTTIDKLLSLGLLYRTASAKGVPLARITDAGRIRLGLPPLGGSRRWPDVTAAAEASAATHERIAP